MLFRLKIAGFTAVMAPYLFLFAATAFADSPSNAAPNPKAFPGAVGAGAYTKGGRGGKVLFVDNLNDSGPGSFRAAVDAKGPRVVVFRVSGVIETIKDIEIRNPEITIAGQTAPGAGICLKGGSFEVKVGEVIIRHLRVRPGDIQKRELDAVSVKDCRNGIFDHISASWGIDETFSVTGDSGNVTVQKCLISESLTRSVHKKGAHGYGSLIVSIGGPLSYYQNLYAHHSSRNPRPGSKENTPGLLLDFRNNAIYDWGFRAGYTAVSPCNINYVGNYLKPGPSTKLNARGWAFHCGGPATKLFMAGNVLEGFPSKSGDDPDANWKLVDKTESYGEAPVENSRMREPFPFGRMDAAGAIVPEDPSAWTKSATDAWAYILDNVGATLPRRDPVDARVIDEARKGTGKLIDTQGEVGGWPEMPSEPAPADQDGDAMPDAWEKAHGLDPASAADAAADPDHDGYSNFEEWINATDPAAADLD